MFSSLFDQRTLTSDPPCKNLNKIATLVLNVVVALGNLPEDPVDSEEDRTRQGVLTGIREVGKVCQIRWQDTETNQMLTVNVCESNNYSKIVNVLETNGPVK